MNLSRAVARGAIALAVAGVCAGCGSGYPAAAIRSDVGAAQTLLHDVAAGRDAGAEALFDARMRTALPATRLQRAWAQVTGRYGTLAGLGTPRTAGAGGDLVVDVPLRLAHGGRIGRVVFDRQGRIVGLFFLA